MMRTAKKQKPAERTITIKVVRDDDAESPRKHHDNLGVMACWHRRYDLGDVQPSEPPDEWLKANAPEGSIVLPLFLYDHSGITMSTGSFDAADPGGWDSGQVGYIVATPDAIRACFMANEATIQPSEIHRTIKILEQEVSTYDDFLTGNVWGYTIEVTHPCGECGHTVHETEHEDSCWGFYGSDPSTLEAMKSHVADEHHAALEAAWRDRG